MSGPHASNGLPDGNEHRPEWPPSDIDRRFRERLCRLVEREIGRRFTAREDPEDVVQSALRSFFRGIKERRFHIDHSGALWRLLETITRRKILKHVEYHTAEKRHPEVEAPLRGELFPNRDPTPEEAAQMTDLVQKVLAGLDSPYPEILRMRLEGHSDSAIAARIGFTRAAVRARRERIRARLEKLL